MLEVTWEKLQKNDTNGNITGYRVCYEIQRSSVDNCAIYKDVDGVDSTTVNLIGLNEATLYFVAVKAGTLVGIGPIRNILNNRTLEAGKQCQFYEVYFIGNVTMCVK